MDRQQEKRICFAALAALLLLQAFALADELTVSRLDTSDYLDHFLIIEGVTHAIEHGGNPLDWFTESPFGYPIIRNYQPFAHVVTALLYLALGKTIPLISVFVFVRYLAIVFLPLSFFLAARWMELPRWTALAVGAIAPLISTNSLYGLEYESYIWQGYGLFAQAVAVHLLLLTLGLSFQAIRRGHRPMLAGLMLGLTFVSHFVYGYIGALTICVMAVVPDRGAPRRSRIFRAMRIGAVSVLVSAFQLATLLLDRSLINPAAPGEGWKADSFGAGTVLKYLLTGDLLDYGRLPVFSLLALSGFVIALWRWRKTGAVAGVQTWAVSGAVLWTIILFGRPAWGSALVLLGIPREFPLHRVIGGLQLFLVLLAGIGLCEIAGAIARRSRPAVAVAVAVLLLVPAVWERGGRLARSRHFHQQYLSMIADEANSLDAVVKAVKRRSGYAYAGLPATWGNMFRVGGGAQFYLFLISNDVAATFYADHAIELSSSMMPLFDDLRPEDYRLFNVSSVVSPPLRDTPPFLTLRLSAGRFRVYDTPATGYLDVVDTVAAVPADRNSFFAINSRWMRSGLVAQRAHVLLDFFGDAPAALPRLFPNDPLPPSSYSAPPGEVSKERRTGDVFEADLNATRPAFALFRMSWHRNWKATLDGRPAKTYMLSPGFVGVPMPPGTHHIVCRYQPDGWRLVAALGGMILALLLVVGERFGRFRPVLLSSSEKNGSKSCGNV